MKKLILAHFILAGLCLLVGLLIKLHVLPYEFLSIRNHTWIDLAQLFLIGSVAAGIYDLTNRKQ